MTDPDPVLAKSADIIATADSAILDGVRNAKDSGGAAVDEPGDAYHCPERARRDDCGDVAVTSI